MRLVTRRWSTIAGAAFVLFLTLASNAIAWGLSPALPVDEEVYYPVKSDDAQIAPAVADNGDIFLFVWVDNRWRPGQQTFDTQDIYGARMASDGTLLDPVGFPIAVNDELQQMPQAIAMGDRFLVFWKDSREGGASVFAARVDADGTVLDPDGFAVTSGTYAQITSARAASDGANALVVWAEFATGIGWSIMGALIDPAGQILAPGVFFICRWDATQDTPDVSWDGTNYVVVYMDTRNYADSGEDIYATRVAADGAVIDPAGFPVTRAASDQDYPRIVCGDGECLTLWDDARNPGDLQSYGAWIVGDAIDPTDAFPICAPPCRPLFGTGRLVKAGADYAAIWTDIRDLSSFRPYGALIAQDGTVTPPGGALLIDDAEAVNAAFAADADGYFGVWSKQVGYWDYDVFGTSLTRDLGYVGTLAGLVMDANGQYDAQVAWADDSGLVLWQDHRRNYSWEVYATRVSPDGAILDEPPIPIYTSGDAWWVHVAYGGGNYLVVYKDPSLPVSYYATVITPDGVDLHPGGIPLFQDIDEDAFALAFNGSDFVIVYEVNDWDYPASDSIYTRLISADGTGHSAYGRLVVDEFGDQTLGDVACSQSGCLAVWHDLRDDPGDIYSSRIRLNGTVADVGGFPIEAEAGAQSWPRVASDGEVFAVAWEDGGQGSFYDPCHIRAKILDGSGNVIVPTFPVSVQDARTQYHATIAWDGEAFSVLWIDTPAYGYHVNESDLYGARFKPDGTFLTPATLIEATAEVEIDPEIASAGGGRLLAAFSRWDTRASLQTDRVYTRIIDFNATTTTTHDSTSTTSTTQPGDDDSDDDLDDDVDDDSDDDVDDDSADDDTRDDDAGDSHTQHGDDDDDGGLCGS